MNRFEGRVALLTAARSGIGAATARRLAAEGATVVLTDVNVERGRAVADELAASSASADFLPLDATSGPAWTQCVARVLDRHGRIDVLHLNAGRNVAGSLEKISDELWRRRVRGATAVAVAGDMDCVVLPVEVAEPDADQLAAAPRG